MACCERKSNICRTNNWFKYLVKESTLWKLHNRNSYLISSLTELKGKHLCQNQKRGSGTGAFSWILRIIKSTLFIEHPWTTAYDIIFFQFFWSGNFEKVARKSPSWYLLVQSQPWNHQNNIYLSKYLYIFIDVVLVSLSLTLTRFHKLFWCFHSCFEQATAYRHAILPISSRVACVGFAILF